MTCCRWLGITGTSDWTLMEVSASLNNSPHSVLQGMTHRGGVIIAQSLVHSIILYHSEKFSFGERLPGNADSLIEYDIMVPKTRFDRLLRLLRRSKRAAMTNSRRFWEDGTIYYSIDGDFCKLISPAIPVNSPGFPGRLPDFILIIINYY